MEFTSAEIILVTLALAIALYHYLTSGLDHWSRKGVPGPRPVPLFGNFTKLFLQKSSYIEVFVKLYRDWRKYPFFGIFRGGTPTLIVNDLQLMKNILIRDFSAFPGRGVRINEDVDPLNVHLFTLDDSRWRYLRTKLSPVFTTGKLRHMFDLMVECADHFEEYLRGEVRQGRILECRLAAAKFTTDVIGSCAFGINMNTLKKGNNEFMNLGKVIVDFGFIKLFKVFLNESAPRLFELLKIQVLPKGISDFFISIMRDTMEHRVRENVVRKDLVDILLTMKQSHDDKDFELTDELLTAQAFVFFIAGFETSSSTISFALYELAHQPEMQEKLRKEILQFLEKHDGKVTYETIKEMTYLDMVVHETLRKNPPVPVLERKSAEPYRIPGTDVTLDKGTRVTISVYAIHHDPEYYPEPEKFDPQRFTEEARNTRRHMTYLPFGDGPKNCIGARFAVYQVKLGIIKVIKNYTIEPTALSPVPYEIQKSLFFLIPKNGVHLKLQPL